MTTRSDLIERYDIDPSLEAAAGSPRTFEARKLVSEANTPACVLDNVDGAYTPRGRSYIDRPEDATEWLHSVEIDGEHVHWSQRVHEDVSNPLSDETVGWTVVKLTEETVVMRNQPDWTVREEVTHEEFAERFAPVTYETGSGENVPYFSY